MKVRLIHHLEVKQLLSMKECIEVMEKAFKLVASGDAEVPLRTSLWLPDKTGLLGMMPGYITGDTNIIGIKVISAFLKNHETPYDSHQGMVLLFETKHGCPLAIIDAGQITAIRTAASSGVATKHLANPDASRLAILGSGTQASKHLEAMLEVRPINHVSVWSLPLDHGRAFVERKSKQYEIEIDFKESSQEAVKDADIICTVTSSSDPVLFGNTLEEGVHINAVGACIPTTRELDTEAVVKSRLYVDCLESALNESGDFLIPKAEGAIGEDHILGELGDLLLGKIKGRQNENEITLFKSLGISVEDLASAYYIYQKALKQDAGVEVELGGLREEG